MDHNPNIHRRPYSLKEYDSNWPRLFKEYSKKIRDILGVDALEVHHFGSTSIPGMFAKPNIDIYVLATSLEAVRSHKQQMSDAGFTPRGDYSGISEEYFTVDKLDGERIASIHIFEGSDDVFIPYRNLRDYLTQNPKEKERYANLKRELYKKFARDYPSYDGGKKELIEKLIEKANAWAQARQ